MPGGDCSSSQERRPCCRRRGGGGGALVEPAALAALLFSGGYGYDMRRTILDMTDGEVDVDVDLAIGHVEDGSPHVVAVTPREQKRRKSRRLHKRASASAAATAARTPLLRARAITARHATTSFSLICCKHIYA